MTHRVCSSILVFALTAMLMTVSVGPVNADIACRIGSDYVADKAPAKRPVRFWSICTGASDDQLEFQWVVLFPNGNDAPTPRGYSRLYQVTLPSEGSYTVRLFVKNKLNGQEIVADQAVTALPAGSNPTPAAPVLGTPSPPTKPATPPKPAANYKSLIQFTIPSSLKRPETAMVSATKPSVGTPHIQWSVDGGRTVTDSWSVRLTTADKPGNKIRLHVLVTDDSNSVNTFAEDFVIKITGIDVAVSSQGTGARVSEPYPITLKVTGGEPPYHLAVTSTPDGTSGKKDIGGVFRFNVTYATPGVKVLDISVKDNVGDEWEKRFRVTVTATLQNTPDISGRWETDTPSIVQIAQNGAVVTGTINYRDGAKGSLSGDIRGDVLYYSWSSYQSSGTGELTISTKGPATMYGNWYRGSGAGRTMGGTWTLCRHLVVGSIPPCH